MSVLVIWLPLIPVEIPVRKPFKVKQILKLFLCWTQKHKKDISSSSLSKYIQSKTTRHIQSRHSSIYSYQTAVSILKQKS